MDTGLVVGYCSLFQKGMFSIVYERNAKLRKPRPRSIVPRPRSCASILEGNQRLPRKSLLPTPEENVLRSAKSQPSVLVPIVASSAAFDRLALTRSSLRNIQVCRWYSMHTYM